MVEDEIGDGAGLRLELRRLGLEGKGRACMPGFWSRGARRYASGAAMTLLLDADVVVVGSGPGGATLARELVRRGSSVLLLERGIDHRRRSYYGTYLGALIYADRRSLLFTDEGLNIVRPLMVGGATSMYCGCAAPRLPGSRTSTASTSMSKSPRPSRSWRSRRFPPQLRGQASTRIAQAAPGLGYDWQPQLKFMRPSRGRALRGACGARCMLGCRCGAKWSAAE